MRFDVVGIDSPCVDLAVNIEAFPEPNKGQRVKALSWQGGGKVATGMVAAARLGAKCAIWGTVGDDLYGNFCVRDFKEHGIDTNYMLKRPGQTTALSVVVSDRQTQGRNILYHPGTAEPIREEELPENGKPDASYFFLSKVDPLTKKVAQAARKAGAKTFIDADSYSEELPDSFSMLDIVVGSEFVYQALFPDGGDMETNCRSLMERGPETVVFTFGEKGCVGVSASGYFSLPAYPVKVVDTVGAGDVFHGAFLAGLLYGLSIEQSARFASAVSAIKCTRIGGRAGIPTREVAERFMESGTIEYEEIDRRVAKYERGIEDV